MFLEPHSQFLRRCAPMIGIHMQMRAVVIGSHHLLGGFLTMALAPALHHPQGMRKCDREKQLNVIVLRWIANVVDVSKNVLQHTGNSMGRLLIFDSPHQRRTFLHCRAGSDLWQHKHLVQCYSHGELYSWDALGKFTMIKPRKNPVQAGLPA